MREGSSFLAPKVVTLTMFDDPQIVRKILELGANAYHHKSASVDELYAALRSATLDPGGEHLIVSLPQGKLNLSEDGRGRDGLARIPSKR